MSFKGIVRELKEMKDGIGNLSRRGVEGRHWRSRTRSHIVLDLALACESIEQGRWATLPPELLLDIVGRVDESETLWPARTVVLSCAAVCRSWRQVTKEIVQTPEKCGRLTFPISLKQPGPRDAPVQCYIKRDRATSTFRLYFGPTPSEEENDKLLLAARKVRRATSTDFVISLVADEFSRASNTYLGKLRSKFLGTKFTIYDSQPPLEATVKTAASRRFHSKQVSPKVPACNYPIATISYELNVLRTRGPRRLRCVMDAVPFSSIQVGGTAPTPKSFEHSFDEPVQPQGKDPGIAFSSTSLAEKSSASAECLSLKNKSPRWHEQLLCCCLNFKKSSASTERLSLKNKSPRWHEQLQCWCLNFKGRVTVASVKNFQLVAAVEPHHNVPAAEQDKVILQFGKLGKDIFTMDYRYPLSAFQAFAVCLSSFDTKPGCE